MIVCCADQLLPNWPVFELLGRYWRNPLGRTASRRRAKGC